MVLLHRMEIYDYMIDAAHDLIYIDTRGVPVQVIDSDSDSDSSVDDESMGKRNVGVGLRGSVEDTTISSGTGTVVVERFHDELEELLDDKKEEDTDADADEDIV